MKIIVGQHKLEIVKEPVNEREIDITKCEFEFDEAITSEYIKEAYFTLDGNTYKQIILNDECDIPSEVLVKKGTVEIGVVAFLVENEEEIKRYNPSPAYFNTWVGSLKDNAENSEPVTPSEMEQYEQALQDGLSEVNSKLDEIDQAIEEANQAVEDAEEAVESTNNLNIDVNKVDKTTQVDLTKKDGTTKTVYINDGTSLQFMWQGTSLGIKTDDMEQYVFVNLQGIQGQPGPQGEPFRIKKTYTSVAEMNADFDNMNVGDYVMIASTVEVEDNAKLYVKGDSQWIFITDFSGATGIKGETGVTPIIRIGTVTSGSTPSVTISGTAEEPVFNFVLQPGEKGLKGDTGATGPTGNGIASIVKTASAGLIDTYTITFTDGTTTTFNITNGADGDVTQEYVDEENERLKSVYNVLPKVSGSGEEVTLENTGDTMLYKMDLKGNTSQEVIQGEVGLEEEDTSIYVDDVNEDKENYITLKGNTYQETTSISGGDQYDSPSPDYPQEIEVVTGLNEVRVEGKNLLENTLTSQTISGVTFTKNSDGTITANGTANANIYLNLNTEVTLNAGTYILSGCPSGGSSSTYTLYENSVGYNKFDYGSGLDITLTETKTFRVSLAIYSGTSVNNLVFKPMIEKGSQATTYEAYKGQTYEVNLGNIELCKIGTYQDRIYKSNGNWYLHKEIGKVVLDGSESWEYDSTYKYFRSPSYVYENLPITNTQYRLSNYFKTISVWATFRNTTDLNCMYIDAIGYKLCFRYITYTTPSDFKTWLSTHNTTVYYVLATPTTTEITDTTLINQLNALYNATIYSTTHINTETSNLLPYINLKYNVITASPSPDRASEVEVVKGNNTITISNEDGTKTQSYNITLGNLELCKIGDYQDYFYKDNGNWYLHKEIGKVVLNGSENWIYYASASTSVFYIMSEFFGIYYKQKANLSCYCDYYKGKGQVASFDDVYNLGNNVITFRTTFTRLVIRDDRFNNIEDFKAELSTNNTTLYYVLATPTTTQITDQLLVSQLDELQKAMSYYDKTIITQTNADKPFILDVIGIRDLQDIFNL